MKSLITCPIKNNKKPYNEFFIKNKEISNNKSLQNNKSLENVKSLKDDKNDEIFFDLNVDPWS